MTLTYRGHAWDDMSEFVAHFTKGPAAADDLWSILFSGRIEGRSPMGIARRRTVRLSQAAACLTEVPVHLLGRVVERYSQFGVAFHHTTVENGSVPCSWSSSCPDSAIPRIVRQGITSLVSSGQEQQSSPRSHPKCPRCLGNYTFNCANHIHGRLLTDLGLIRF
jgi:hypothetical protein